MELEIKTEEFIKVDQDGFICLSGRDYLSHVRSHSKEKGLALLSKIITSLGERSAAAQKLKQVITTPPKFYGSEQRLYLKVAGNKALGFVKVGERKLFYHDHIGNIKELTPTCVLDFYVHESCQRNGLGKEIFEKFLKIEGKIAEKLAYDRPSEKLMGFLKKHYGLSGFIAQNNNYVIFDRFFSKAQKLKMPLSPKGSSNKPIIQTNSKSNLKVESITAKNRQQLNVQLEQAPSFKTVKDQTKSSFGCPWAVEQKAGFKTSSNTYGSHYPHR